MFFSNCFARVRRDRNIKCREAIFDAVAELQPNAYGVTVHEKLSQTYKDISLAIIYSHLTILEKEGKLESKEVTGDAKRSFRSKRLYFVKGA